MLKIADTTYLSYIMFILDMQRINFDHNETCYCTYYNTKNGNQAKFQYTVLMYISRSDFVATITDMKKMYRCNQIRYLPPVTINLNSSAFSVYFLTATKVNNQNYRSSPSHFCSRGRKSKWCPNVMTKYNKLNKQAMYFLLYNSKSIANPKKSIRYFLLFSIDEASALCLDSRQSTVQVASGKKRGGKWGNCCQKEQRNLYTSQPFLNPSRELSLSGCSKPTPQ